MKSSRILLALLLIVSVVPLANLSARDSFRDQKAAMVEKRKAEDARGEATRYRNQSSSNQDNYRRGSDFYSKAVSSYRRSEFKRAGSYYRLAFGYFSRVKRVDSLNRRAHSRGTRERVQPRGNRDDAVRALNHARILERKKGRIKNRSSRNKNLYTIGYRHMKKAESLIHQADYESAKGFAEKASRYFNNIR